jgi:hypothetical protein
MDARTFRTDENWHGSYYELCLELGPAGDNSRLLAALRSLWSHPMLAGFWTDRKSFGSAPSDFQMDENWVVPHYGVLTIGESQLGGVTHVVRETDGADWLDLCVPTGMLELVYDVAYPLYFESNAWINPLNALFVSLAVTLHERNPFRMAIIGEEASGLTDADSITTDDISRGLFVIPEAIVESLGIRDTAVQCADGLFSVGLTGG